MKTANREKFNNSAVCMGNFDGVHRAHQRLIGEAVKSGLLSIVYTFSPHPLRVMGVDVSEITDAKKKAELIEKSGADVLYTEECDIDFMSIEPQDFVHDILVGRLGAKKVYVGYDFRFGHKSAGDTNLLKKMGSELGFETFVLPEMSENGVPIKSSAVRELIENGDFQGANAMLGRAHTYSGTVVKCKQLGRTLGFPTANILPEIGLVIPKYGVYATKVSVDGKTFDGVSNVGINPTVEAGNKPKIETHIIGFEENIYGKRIEIAFYGMLRSEKKFFGEADLAHQIEKDVLHAKKYLTNIG